MSYLDPYFIPFEIDKQKTQTHDGFPNPKDQVVHFKRINEIGTYTVANSSSPLFPSRMFRYIPPPRDAAGGK